MKNTVLDYAPAYITSNNRTYTLRYPLRCLFETENGYFIIKSEILDIIGTGKTEEEAECNFAEEFDYIYRQYNSLTDNQLSKKLQTIKNLLNIIVLKVN